MTMRAKIFLLWLLALAIPLQGFAAVAQSGCAPTMTAMPAMMMHDMSAMDEMSHTMSHDMQHDMQHTMAMQDHGTPDSSHPQHKSGMSCSSCATCTVGAVLPLALTALPAPDLPAREYLILPASGFVGYTPENPDRPPALS